MAITASRNDETGDGNSPHRRVPQQSRARATRQAILTAAAEHFARYGFHPTSLDRVLADSGGTKGALYFHFSSKQDLARAVVAEMEERWRLLRVEVGTRGLDPLFTLLELIDEVIARLISSPIARGGSRLVAELGAEAPEFAAASCPGEHDTEVLLEEAARAGLLREGSEPAGVARQVVALLAGHRQLSDAEQNPSDLWRRMNEAWTLVLPAIATDAWLARWRASSWVSRPCPVLEPDER